MEKIKPVTELNVFELNVLAQLTELVEIIEKNNCRHLYDLAQTDIISKQKVTELKSKLKDAEKIIDENDEQITILRNENRQLRIKLTAVHNFVHDLVFGK